MCKSRATRDDEWMMKRFLIPLFGTFTKSRDASRTMTKIPPPSILFAFFPINEYTMSENADVTLPTYWFRSSYLPNFPFLMAVPSILTLKYKEILPFQPDHAWSQASHPGSLVFWSLRLNLPNPPYKNVDSVPFSRRCFFGGEHIKPQLILHKCLEIRKKRQSKFQPLCHAKNSKPSHFLWTNPMTQYELQGRYFFWLDHAYVLAKPSNSQPKPLRVSLEVKYMFSGL